MEFLELARRRFSVRKYQDRPVEEDKLLRVIEAARVAPSAHNKQPTRLVVLRNGALKAKVAALYEREWLTGAPVVVAVCVDHGRAWKREDGKGHGGFDAAIGVDHMMLAAAEEGLGTCCVCDFSAAQCASVLELPAELEVVALLPIGYPAVEGDPGRHDGKRIGLDELVHWDGFRRE